MGFYFVQASPRLSFPLPDQRPIGRNPGLKWSSEGRGYSALIAQMWIEPPKASVFHFTPDRRSKSLFLRKYPFANDSICSEGALVLTVQVDNEVQSDGQFCRQLNGFECETGINADHAW